MSNENKIAHLGFIQLIINRLANNSFVTKGWCITLTSALTAISNTSFKSTFLFAYLPIIFFWLLDSFFLWKERLYRDHYEEIQKLPDKKIDFSMRFSKNTLSRNSFINSAFSITITPFYLILLLTIYIVAITINHE